VDERLVAPENRFEVIDGQVIECAPAEEAHATVHSNVDFVIRAHTRPSYRVAVDMLTRSNRFSDTAPDIAVFPEARDPVMGGRQVEHIAIEVRDTQSFSDVTAKTRLLHQRGVRRVVCLDLPKSRVLEWNATQGDWDELPLSSSFVDRTCFVRGIPVSALLDVGLAENTAAAALLTKKNPVLEKALEERHEQGLEQGREEGREAGREAGREEGLRVAVLDLCEAYGVKLSDARRAHLDSLDHEGLDALRTVLKQSRAWPSPLLVR
jgi:Uma2 family endonuclease